MHSSQILHNRAIYALNYFDIQARLPMELDIYIEHHTLCAFNNKLHYFISLSRAHAL